MELCESQMYTIRIQIIVYLEAIRVAFFFLSNIGCIKFTFSYKNHNNNHSKQVSSLHNNRNRKKTFFGKWLFWRQPEIGALASSTFMARMEQ